MHISIGSIAFDARVCKIEFLAAIVSLLRYFCSGFDSAFSFRGIPTGGRSIVFASAHQCAGVRRFVPMSKSVAKHKFVTPEQYSTDMGHE